jgi:hypothetical protein
MKGNFISRFILFLFAYVPIYFILALKSFNENVLYTNNRFNSFYHIIKNNRTSISLILLVIILMLFFYIYSKISLKAQGNPKFEIKEISTQNKEYITYLGTYILPFIALETKTLYDIAAYIVLFITMGLIYVRTNLIYTNPMLLFFGYDLFEIIDNNNNKLVCISKEHFKNGDKPIGIKLGENTYIISKWKKEN